MLCAPIHDCVANLNSSNCDFMLCYFHPSGPLLLDGTQYPSLKIAQERLLPVSVPDAAGEPLYSLEGRRRGPVPYLDYGPQSFIIKLVKTILADRPDGPTLETVFESGLVFALKAMVLKGYGLTWLPETAVAAELAEGKLVPAGSASWTTRMDLRIYRSTRPLQREAERFWSFLSDRAAAGN
jgi:DNA-binding transcriptional LysR family regulator